MGEMSFNGGRDEGEGVATLLAASLDHRQHRLHKTAATRTLCPKRKLPPDHRMTQRSFASVVRWLDSFVAQKCPQPLAMLVQLAASQIRRDSRFEVRAAANAPPSGGLDPSDAAMPLA